MIDINNIKLMDILPPSISDDPDIKAMAEAIDNELHKVAARIPNVSILPRLRETTDSSLIDALAYQMHVDSYDSNLLLKVRRELVAKSLDWHTRKGTPAVVEEVITAHFGSGKVVEWFQYGGEPYYFKVFTENYSITQDQKDKFLNVLNQVKRESAWLESVEYVAMPQGNCTSYTAIAVAGIAMEITAEVKVYDMG